MATYPGSIYSHTTLTDAVDYPQASHINTPAAEIVAIETELGASPKSIDDTVTPGSTPTSVANYLDMVANLIKKIGNAANWYSSNPIRYVACQLIGNVALTTSEKVYFRIPAAMNGMNLVSVAGSVGTGAAGASSSGTPTFTVKNVTDNNQMLSTSLTIDANEYTSATATTAAVIDTTKDDVVTDDLIEIAVTTAGTGTTYAVVTLGFQLP